MPVHSDTTKKGHLVLLAVSETDTGYIGKTADLFLEIQPGEGRVFIQTYPVSKIDTQISTRFANSIACKITEKDCSKYDFFYTIKSDSSIIGGPSAGAPITLLTIALLNDEKYDEKIAMTGTINSGGLIGPVGGVKEKIEAAARAGIKKILISEADVDANDTIIDESLVKFLNLTENNSSVKLKDLEDQLNVSIVKVLDIYEAYKEFTGKSMKRETGDIKTDEGYINIMRMLAGELCSRADELKETVDKKMARKGIKHLKENNSYYEDALNLSMQAKQLFQEGKYYSAASRCYGSSLDFEILNILFSNLTDQEVKALIKDTKRKINLMDIKTRNWKIETITDLEAFMIVQERLIEASEHINKAEQDNITTNSTKIRLANAIERLYSGKSWSTYYGSGKVKFNLDQQSLKQSCTEKLSEAEEKLEFIKLLMNEDVSEIRKGIDMAYEDMISEEYALCLFKASKANAESSLLLSSLGLTTSNIDKMIYKKLDVAKSVIYSQTKKGMFPILGYSYYEYAQELVNSSKYSAMLYTEYAMELSNLDMYFKKQEKISKAALVDKIDSSSIIIFLCGIIVGMVLAMLILLSIAKKHNSVKNKKENIPVNIIEANKIKRIKRIKTRKIKKKRKTNTTKSKKIKNLYKRYAT